MRRHTQNWSEWKSRLDLDDSGENRYASSYIHTGSCSGENPPQNLPEAFNQVKERSDNALFLLQQGYAPL